jgi:glycosyltransferase involved in cell wall biosynthesis
LRIGIDCRALVGEKTGIGYYLWEILVVWAEKNIDFELWLYAPKDFYLPSEFLKSKLIYKKRIFKLKSYEFWKHLVLPVQIAVDKIDIFWGPNYSQPYFPIPIPTILTIHDVVYLKYPKTLKTSTLLHNRFGLESYLKYTDKIIVPSLQTKKDLIDELQIESERITVTELGVSNRFNLKQNNESKYQNIIKNILNESYILTVGTLEPRKNIENIITSYYLAKKKHSNLKLVVVGKEGWGNNVKLKKHFDNKNIYWLGYVDENELVSLYKNALLFIYISLYEGFGMPVLEAMKIGTPVIASNRGALSEVVSDKGLLVDPLNINEISDKISELIDDKLLRQNLGLLGTEYSKLMNWEVTAEKTLNEIVSVIMAINM